MKMNRPSDESLTLVIVVPVFNEALVIGETLPSILAQVRAGIQVHTPEARVILLAIDDGSIDATRNVLNRLANDAENIFHASFTRNFGKEAAIHAGISLALNRYKGDALVVMDSDLQHPPQLVGTMWRLWLEGHPVVEAVKRSRGDESSLRRVAASLFYDTFSRATGLALSQDTDFKLLDRTVAQAVVQMTERARFFRGIVRWLGFESTRVEFDVAPRFGGASAWSYVALARYAWRNVTLFSSAPMRIVTILGLLGFFVGAVLGVKALFDKFTGHSLDGFSTVILLVIIFGSLILLSLGVIGSYIAQIYDEVKQRPYYVLRPDDASHKYWGQ